ncbi:MAG: ATPase P [Ruminococcus sp.]|nr:ATPase P [Ruminococcus sp.]
MIRTVLEIDGMMCGMCEAHINDAVRREFKVKKVTSSHKKGITEIISEQAPDKERLTAIITELGYKLNGISEEEYKKKGFFSRK